MRTFYILSRRAGLTFAICVATFISLLSSPAQADTQVHQPGQPANSQAVRCTPELYLPDLERAQDGAYITYGEKYICNRPTEMSLNIALQQKFGNSYITADTASRYGVATNLVVLGSASCRNLTRSTYRMSWDDDISGVEISGHTQDFTFDCDI